MNLALILADALLGFVITFGTAAGALLAQDGVSGVGDVSQAAWLAAFAGALVATAKTLQSRFGAQPSHHAGGNGQSGRALPGLLLVLGLVSLLAVSLQGCATQPQQPREALAQAALLVGVMVQEVGIAQQQGLITAEREGVLLTRLRDANQELHEVNRLLSLCEAGHPSSPTCSESLLLLDVVARELSQIRDEYPGAQQ